MGDVSLTGESVQQLEESVQQEQETIKHRARKAAERARAKAKHVVEEHKPKLEKAESAIQSYSPSVFLGLSLASIISSMVLFFRKSKDNAMFVGLWAPTFLALGMFFTLIGVRKRG